MSFNAKTAVVTGALGGMGAQIVADLRAAGARVAAFDLRDPQGPADDSVRYYTGDLTDPDFVAGSIADVVAWAGGIDLLANVAGLLDFEADRSLVDIDLHDWDRCLSANLSSMMHCSRCVAPIMASAGAGAMVHFSSTQAMRGDDRPQDAYQAAKAAIIALSKSLAIQFAGQGVRSNVIVPGPTASPMQARWTHDPKSRRAVEAVVPLGRVGTTQDMADAALFLLSGKASYITGTELIVDGGLLARP